MLSSEVVLLTLVHTSVSLLDLLLDLLLHFLLLLLGHRLELVATAVTTVLLVVVLLALTLLWRRCTWLATLIIFLRLRICLYLRYVNLLAAALLDSLSSSSFSSSCRTEKGQSCRQP